MTIAVMDEDVTANDAIGKVTIKLSALCMNNGIDDYFGLTHNGSSAGTIHLKSVWTP